MKPLRCVAVDRFMDESFEVDSLANFERRRGLYEVRKSSEIQKQSRIIGFRFGLILLGYWLAYSFNFLEKVILSRHELFSQILNH